MEKVKESLLEYTDDMFFMPLFENDLLEGEEDEQSPAEKQKEAAQKEKDGMAVVKRCINNWKAFKTDAGKIWQEYRDFWAAQKEADESIGQKGMYYNLYKSNYIVGVVKSVSGAAELKVYNTSANTGETDKEGGEFETFICKNPTAIQAFTEFFKGEVEGTMKEIISGHKEAMEAKKKADTQRAKEEETAAKRSKLDAFLNES